MYSNLQPLSGWEYEDNNVSTLSALVVGDVVAPADDGGAAKDLRVSASSNLMLGTAGEDALRLSADASTVELGCLLDKTLRVSSATDSNEVLLGGLYCRSDYANDVETISTNLTDINIAASNTVIDGNAEVTGDHFVGGSIIGNTVNLLNTQNGTTIGYGLAVDSQDELVIVKYDSSSGVSRVVARFGRGVIVGPDNTPSGFPTYRGKPAATLPSSQAVDRANQNAKFFRKK